MSIESSIRYAFHTVNANKGFWYGSIAILLGVSFVLSLIIGGISAATTSLEDLLTAPSATDKMFAVLKTLTQMVIVSMLGVVFANNALKELNGQKPTLGTFFQGIIPVPSLIIGAIFGVVSTLIVLPMQWPSQPLGLGGASSFLFYSTLSFTTSGIGALLALLAWPLYVFSIHTALDGNSNLGSCFQQGLALGKKNYVPLLFYVLFSTMLVLLGLIPCGLGTIFFVPIVIVSTAHLYRTGASHMGTTMATTQPDTTPKMP